jgi:hypothetical protein
MGTHFLGSQDDLERFHYEFDRNHYLRLPQLLEPALLQTICQQIDTAPFYERVHPGIGSNKELCLPIGGPSGLLHVLFNGEPLFQLVQQITGCTRIGCFRGRVYRFAPNSGHHDAWHGDLDDNRMVALSLNLSPAPYAGGVLQIRRTRDQTLLQEIPNTGFGDAVLFRLAASLEHRVTEVTGEVPKTAFAGWFQSRPDFLTMLRFWAERPAVSDSGERTHGQA